MSPIGHSILASSTLSTAKKLKTPLKASVVILTTVILASCGSDSSSKSYYTTPSDIPTTPDAGGDTGATGGNTGAIGGNTGATGGNTGATGGNTGATGGNTGATGGNTGATGGNTGATGGNTGATGGNTGATGGNTGATGGNTGATGGNTGATGGNTETIDKDVFDAAVERAEKAEQEAKNAKEKAAAAEKSLQEAQDKIKILQEQIAAGGDTSALKEQLAAEKTKLTQLEQQIANSQGQVAAAEKAAKDALDALKAAEDAAKIKNAPEANKSGVQTLNVNVAPLGKVFKTTTRDFDADKNSVVARADLASETAPGKGDGLLGKLTITTSGEGDKELTGSNGFKAHDDTTNVEALGQKLPLTYTSTYKDFGDDMRIGHIDGKAALELIPGSLVELPVSGAAVIGNATKAENMPTEGTVGYTGDATHRKLGIGNAIEFGSSVFTADFVKKALDGKLSFAKAGNIDLKANINGNKFSGAADSNGGYATEGGFFGGDAQYLGGVYEGNDAQGTYGAKSDKQAAADNLVKDAKAVAEEAKKQADQATKDAASAQADLDKTKAEIERLETLIASGGAGNGELQAQLDAVKADLTKALNDKQTALDQLKEVQNKVISLEAEVKGLKGDNSKLASDLTKAKNELQAAQNSLTAKDAEIKKQQETIDNLQTKLNKANDDKITAENDANQALLDKQVAEQKASEATEKAEEAKTKAQEAEQKLKAAQDKIKQLEDELENSGSGGNVNVDELKAKLEAAKEDKKQLESELQAAKDAETNAKTAAEAQVAAANKAAQDAKDALAAAQIKNAPEAAKSGVQSINVGTSVAGLPDFVVITRDFEIGKDNVIARADIASNDLLPKVDVNVSGAGDKQLANGFMSHDDNTSIPTALGELPLAYTSVYKDYGNDMRIAHIDGAANLNGTNIPVDGVAALGNATKVENIPTEGTAGYTGDATYRKLGIGNAVEFGSSVFTADFVKKALDGKLSFAKAGNIDLKANITGNKFSGAADANGGYATEGGFFGGDAQYLGGIYDGNGAQGTYGAKSDKQTLAEQVAKDAQAAAAAAKAAADKANASAQAAQKAAKEAQAQLADKQAEIERLQRRIDNAGSGNNDALQQLQDELDAAIEAAKQANQQKDDALEQLTAAQATIIELQGTVDGLKGDNTQLQADLVQAKKDLQAQIDKLKSDNTNLQAQADSLQAELDKLRPKVPENKEYKAAKEITGVQSNKISGYISNAFGQRDGALQTDGQGSYETLTIKAQGLNTDYAREEFKIILKDNEKDKVYKDGNGKSAEGFKVYTSPQAVNVPGTSLNNGVKESGKLAYTSVYNKFDNMQIGHVYGGITGKSIAKGQLSTVYANGNATADEDMVYMQQLAKHNLQQGLQNGEGVNSGKVGYAGVSTYQKNGDYSGLAVGTSKFDVDFVNQQLDGTLAFKGTDIDNKKIKAEINGNKFSGNWNGLDTQGGFFGQDAAELGGVYKDAGGKGTYGAKKGAELPGTTETDMTGFQSTALSSVYKELPLGLGVLQNAIGYADIRDDKSDFIKTEDKDGDLIPVDNRQGDNFKAFDKGFVRGDMVKPDSVLKPIEVSLQKGGSVTVDAGKGGSNPTFKYTSVYQNFDQQMQIGHVYGNFDSLAGDVSRAANVYVQGYATTKEAMADLASVNAGKASYVGTATYIENLHLGDNANTAPVKGTSNFDVDFVNNAVKGELAFAAGQYKYMPKDSKIGIEATINGNTFIGNKNGIDTAGGFYGDDAQFLGGIYQDASVEGGKGTVAGTGTKFQGTFGAEKQSIEK